MTFAALIQYALRSLLLSQTGSFSINSHGVPLKEKFIICSSLLLLSLLDGASSSCL